jgi:hypothetical protein
VFSEILWLLRQSVIPSDLRAALLDLLAGLPGIRTNNIESLGGQPVVAVSFPTPA